MILTTVFTTGPVNTVLFYADRKERLFKITVKIHKNNKNEISYSSWGPQFDEWECSRSIWAYAQFIFLLSNTKNIAPRDIAARIDEIVLIGETETKLGSTEVSPGSSNMNPIGLPDLETIWKKQIQTLRYIPVKFRKETQTKSGKLTVKTFSAPVKAGDYAGL